MKKFAKLGIMAVLFVINASSLISVRAGDVIVEPAAVDPPVAAAQAIADAAAIIADPNSTPEAKAAAQTVANQAVAAWLNSLPAGTDLAQALNDLGASVALSLGLDQANAAIGVVVAAAVASNVSGVTASSLMAGINKAIAKSNGGGGGGGNISIAPLIGGGGPTIGPGPNSQFPPITIKPPKLSQLITQNKVQPQGGKFVPLPPVSHS